MTVVNISNHGRITIPAEIRRKYGWEDGDKVIVIDHPLEGIKILPYLSEDQLKSTLDRETTIKVINEISKERKMEIEREKDRLYQRDFD
ncbi:MAG: AbrB/MazE/SpoVT family DNA-binding domain-containing protein [Candidatus Lokiarchaeota archaeon]|jgi:AbrB family looped-hinge helix DNA binding protein|nr:AbrB/MazE/SpoVT family DNA-binding domain-containing protein [Candidatus Lokiarchaeota archaeon]